jgi:hypothetical protein
MNNPKLAVLTVLLPALLLAGAESAEAQSIWLEPPVPTDVNLEVLNPAIQGSEMTTFSLMYFLSGRIGLAQHTVLVAEIPYAHYAPNSDYYGYFQRTADNAFGSPYIGLHLGPYKQGWQGEIGLRLPLAERDKYATQMGLLGDFLERAEAFLPDVLTVVAGGNYRYKSSDGFALRLRLAPLLWIGTGDNSGMDPELFFLYAVQIGYEDQTVAVGGGLSGRYGATIEDADFGERSFHQLGLYMNFDFGGWGPGVQLRVPLDEDLGDFLDPTLSLSVSFRNI